MSRQAEANNTRLQVLREYRKQSISNASSQAKFSEPNEVKYTENILYMAYQYSVFHITKNIVFLMSKCVSKLIVYVILFFIVLVLVHFLFNRDIRGKDRSYTTNKYINE